MAWTAPDGMFLGVFGQRFDAQGARVGLEFMVNEVTTGEQYDPQVASDGAGNFTVVYPFLPPIVGPRPGLFARRFDRAGVPREDSFLVHAPSPGYGNDEGAVAGDAAGNFVVAWARNSADIRAQRFGGLRPVLMFVDSSPSGGSNFNGILDPGETVVVQSYWANRNGQALTFSGSAASFGGPGPAGDPSYTVLDGTANYGTVPNGATGNCAMSSDCYLVAVSTPSARPAQHWDATLHRRHPAGEPGHGEGLVAARGWQLLRRAGDEPLLSLRGDAAAPFRDGRLQRGDLLRLQLDHARADGSLPGGGSRGRGLPAARRAPRRRSPTCRRRVSTAGGSRTWFSGE